MVGFAAPPPPKPEPALPLDNLFAGDVNEVAVVLSEENGVPKIWRIPKFWTPMFLFLLSIHRPAIRFRQSQRPNAAQPNRADTFTFAESPRPVFTFSYETEEGSYTVTSHGEREPASILLTTKKYKPIAKKVRASLENCPEKFCIERNITGDPLATMPELNPNPPEFSPTGCYTVERKEAMDRTHRGDFLWPGEQKLLHNFMCKHNDAFAWSDSEPSCFNPEFFPLIKFPVLLHTLWVEKNIPIPPGLYKKVCKILKKKIAAGVYEPSNSSYHLQWFCVLKKDGKSLWIVHSLEPLNKVMIQHSGVPPTPDYLVEQFSGRPCGAIFDLYVGYDE
ncbi:hypothetical protein BN946_scf184662.g11 [Trametes cinnabarina]|uniref:Uncharacterized protein n=1 Tax=Pycnoporus cinnabarinus TaxID=5643 RepID=A0A060S5M3_PYCCI|nr:hypothetical protein BN946_scf184662.g11 [Trametes cinnabarina]